MVLVRSHTEVHLAIVGCSGSGSGVQSHGAPCDCRLLFWQWLGDGSMELGAIGYHADASQRS